MLNNERLFGGSTLQNVRLKAHCSLCSFFFVCIRRCDACAVQCSAIHGRLFIVTYVALREEGEKEKEREGVREERESTRSQHEGGSGILFLPRV